MRVMLLVAGTLAIIAQAAGQTMYRCGSVYQDRPCDAGAKAKVVGSTGSAAAAPAPAAGADPECMQRARDSQKIVWAREGGATEERLLSEARSEEQEAAVAIAAALRAGREIRDAPPATTASGSSLKESPQPSRAELVAEQRAENCARYSEDMDRLRSEERAGGSSSRMDALNERRRALRERMSRAGC